MTNLSDLEILSGHFGNSYLSGDRHHVSKVSALTQEITSNLTNNMTDRKQYIHQRPTATDRSFGWGDANALGKDAHVVGGAAAVEEEAMVGQLLKWRKSLKNENKHRDKR